MGHKIHPKGLRLGYTQDWQSRWFAPKNMPALIMEDFQIRQIVESRFVLAAVSSVGIERAGSFLRVNIHTARPGVVIGKKGADIEALRKDLEALTGSKTFVNVIEIKNPETFLNFWRFYFNMPGISVSGSEKTLNAVTFNLQHVWFLTLLFFITLMVVLWSLLLKKNNGEATKVDGSNKVISKTIIFAAALGLAYAAVHIYYVGRQINFSAWLLVGKVIQFQLNKIWVLLPLFLFGLYVYKKNWLTRSDIGSWKMWGGAAFLLLAIYLLIYHFGILPALEEIFKVVDRNMQSDDKMEMPVVADSIRRAFLLTWILLPPVCVFLLMFFLSFAKRFFNQPNAATTFCSKHSINVYVLHYAPVLILQYTFLNVAVPSMVKILLMAIIIIPACLWLSHRLVYPYPKAAIAFFVALKLMALAAGFTFYCFALLALIFISFAGAVYESVKYLNARTTGLKSA